MTTKEKLYKYVLRIADDSLILGQRLAEWCGHGPILEEDIALTNISLDLIGQATNLLEFASKLDNEKQSSDDLAFLRTENKFTNILMVEQPNKDFGYTMVRQFFFDTFRKLFYEQLTNSADSTLASIAAKSLKETKYHFKHSAEWVIRLGDGTEESKRRVSEAISFYWKYTDELFYQDEIDHELIDLSIAFDLTDLKAAWLKTVNEVLAQATIPLPSDRFEQKGGRKGTHSEHLGFLLAEMQYMQRTYPNSVW